MASAGQALLRPPGEARLGAGFSLVGKRVGEAACLRLPEASQAADGELMSPMDTTGIFSRGELWHCIEEQEL